MLAYPSGFLQVGRVPRKPLTSITDQVTDILQQGMLQGRWRHTLPGRDQLADELGCSHWTVETAMRRLTQMGLLVSQGNGRPRRIVLPEGASSTRPLQIQVLAYEDSDRVTAHLLDMLHGLQHAGHDANFATKTMQDLGMDAKRIARFVSRQAGDAWIVVAGPRDVLEWFSRQPFPTFALFGRFLNLNLACLSPKKLPAMAEWIGRLVAMGHRRIVNVVREDRRKPDLGGAERRFMEELARHGITTGPYHLPDWGDSPDELLRLLDSLFGHTPPTALLFDEPMLLIAARDHLARKGIHAPEDVSLACSDTDPVLSWCRPVVTHIRWDSAAVARRMVQWARNISRGQNDRRTTLVNAELVIGGTTGPAPKSRTGSKW